MNHHNRHKKETGAETLITGLVLTGVFGVTWFLRGDWWWIFPFAFAGVLPAVEGVRKLIRERNIKKSIPQAGNISEEKKVLMVAKNENGIVTPALIALNSNLTIDKAEEILARMVKNGHASMNVLDAGRVEYEFPEFRKGIEKKK